MKIITQTVTVFVTDSRLRTAYVDESTDDIDAAIDTALEWKSQGIARSMGVRCNATELLARLIERQVVPDVLTDQTSAHDPLDGYIPDGMTYEQAGNSLKMRFRSNPRELTIGPRACRAG